jgi:hypothetical protein
MQLYRLGLSILILGVSFSAGFAQTTVPLAGRVVVKLVADGARPKMYALNRGNGISSGSLLALNPTNGQLLAEIALGLSPTDMAMTSAGDSMFVVNTGSRTLMKVDLTSFSVAATRSISTPNTYDPNNPLYLGVGSSNVVYFTDGGWSPGIYTFDFQSGTNLSLFDDDNGTGGLVVTRNGKTLYTWRQYGWGAGNVNSWVTRFNAENPAIVPLESSFVSWRRDPLDTPILLNMAETLVFNKQQAFVATNVNVLVQEFPENIYAITRDGSIAFGSSRVFLSATALQLITLDFSSTVQSLSGNQQSLFRYRASPSELVIYQLADIVGAGWETNQPPIAAFVRTPTNATTLTNIIFNASGSTDDQGGGTALEYRWDWENDGAYDTAFTNQFVASYRYNLAGTKTVALQVKDRYGATSVALQSFNVVQQDDPGVPGGGNPQFEVQLPAADVAFDPVRPYAYVSGYDNKSLAMLNLTNGLIERQFSFDWYPESIAISPNGQKMYVALLRRPHRYYGTDGHTNYIAEFDLVQRLKLKEFEILADPYDLVVTDAGILVVPGGSDQWTDIGTYRTSDGALLGTRGIRHQSRISLHPSQQAVYTADTDLSPSDIQRYDFNPVSGVFLSSWDSPYHGDYSMGGNVWCHPSGTNVLVRGGGIFSSSPVQSQDLRYQRTLAGGTVQGAEFDAQHNALFTVAGSILTYYNLKTYEPVLSMTVTNGVKYIHAKGNYLYVAWLEDNETRFQRYLNPAVGAETNQPPVAAYVRTPTNATTLTNIIFDATGSTDDQGGGTALEYRWDWENDGVYDTAFTNQFVVSHRYNLAGTKTVALQVKDRYGATSVALQSFNVVQQDDPGVPGGGNPQFEVQFPATDVAFDPVRSYAYVSGYDNKSLAMLNLTNGLIERQFSFDWYPESIAISPNGQKMYVALLRRPHRYYGVDGHTNYIAEFDLVQRLKLREFEILADPYDLAVTDGGILVVPGGSDQWTDIRTYRTSDGALLGTSGIRHQSRISLHPSQQAVYTADTDLSPSDIRRYDFNPVSGVFLSSWDSPYHGDYPMSGNVWCHPGGTNVVVRGGGIFSSSPVVSEDLRYQRTLAGGTVEVAAFDLPHNALFTVGNSGSTAWLRQYELPTYQLVNSLVVSNGTRFLQAKNRDVYLAWTDGNGTFFQRIQNPALPDAFITQQPQSQTTAEGGTLSLNVEVRGQPPFGYQWFFQNNALLGATNQFLVLNNLRSNQEGDYFVTVTNAYASVTSLVAHVVVLVPPSIVQQPHSVSAAAGTSVSFSVQAAGSPVLAYQWSFEGINIAGATNSSYSISNVQQSHGGAYAVAVQNSVGVVSSSPANLRVLPAVPTVLTNPLSQNVPAGSDVQLSIAASGTAPITYQWWFNGSPLPASVGTPLLLTNVQTSHSGYYSVFLSNSVGQIFSEPASLTVSPSSPWFLSQPTGKSGVVGNVITLNAEARGSLPLFYQWRKDGLTLPAGANSSLVLSNVTIEQSGLYDLVVYNGGGSITSVTAIVTITGAPPAFVQQPSNTTVNQGATLNLNSLASGTDPMSYQWWFNKLPIPNQTARSLTITNVAATVGGDYFVVASNSFGRATSVTASVTVQTGPQFTAVLSNQLFRAGQHVTIAVQAQGAAPLTYFWSYNGLPYRSGTNSALILAKVQPAQAGVYGVVASNSVGTASTAMTLFGFDTPGSLIAWGDNTGGQTNLPPGLGDFVKVSGGDFHSLALQANGLVAAWGFNGNGQTNVPSLLSNVVSISAGAYHSLALRLNGQVTAWGYNSSGQIIVPDNATSVVAIASGESHSVALRQDGSLVVWGDNTLGQRNVQAGSGFVTAVAAGRNHTLALRNSGTVFAWGQNSAGQTAVPPGLTGVKAIAAGYLHSLALRTNGSLVAWGDNTYQQVSVPTGLTNVIGVTAGDFHSYALTADGRVVAWGENSWGQLDLPPVCHHVRFVGSAYYGGLATVAPVLNWTSLGRQLVFSWAGPFDLEYADTANGEFKWMSSTTPYTYESQNSGGFFRLKRKH